MVFQSAMNIYMFREWKRPCYIHVQSSDITEQIEDIYFNVLTLNIEFISRHKTLIFSRVQSTSENIEKSCLTREMNPNSK